MTEIVRLRDTDRPRVDAALHGGVLSIGNFDGVHVGHAELLRQTHQLARQLSGPSIACLFDPHPIAILRPDLAPERLTSVEERARRMRPLEIDYLVVCRTSQALLDMSAKSFFRSLVVANLRCDGMVEGANFCFGKDRRGDVALLEELCREHGIRFRIADMRSVDGQPVSSTRIRDALGTGDVAAAARMMATPHRVTGVVVPGDRRGRTIGFPTANLDQIGVVIPAPGVYAARAHIDGGVHRAAVHIGESPTFQSGADRKVEVHVLDFEGDLYDRSVSVDFVDRIRGVSRFASADDLAGQLKRDVQTARQMIAPFESP